MRFGVGSKLFILFVMLPLLVLSASALLTNYTIDASVPVRGTASFQSGQGHALVKNSTGARYVTYLTQESGNNIFKLAWSTDGGVTWKNKTIPMVNGYAISQTMPEISIDSSDTVHLTYITNTYFLEYVNYTMSGGFGSVSVLNITFSGIITAWLPSMAIDSTDTVHVVYASDYFTYYTNISPITGVAASTYNLSAPSNLCASLNPHLEVDQNNIVHIIRDIDTGCGVGIFQLRYQNFSTSGWGTEFNMTDYPSTHKRIFDMTIDANKIHLIMINSSSPLTVTYANTSGDTNFKLSPTMIVPMSTGYSGLSMSEDLDGTLHFIIQTGGTRIWYYNFTSSGLSRVQVMYPTGSGMGGPNLLWSTYPAGNIPQSGFELLYSKNIVSVNYTIYGPDPISPQPTPVWLNQGYVNNYMEGLVEIGLIVIVLGITALLFISRISNV